MDMKKSFQLAFGLITLSDEAVTKILSDREGLKKALILFAIGALATAFGPVFSPPSYEGIILFKPNFGDAIGMAVGRFLVDGLFFYLLGEVGLKLFDSRLDGKQMLTLLGTASVLGVFGLIPALAPLASLWVLIVGVVMLRKHAKLNWLKLVLLVVIVGIGMAALSSLLSSFGLDLRGSWIQAQF